MLKKHNPALNEGLSSLADIYEEMKAERLEEAKKEAIDYETGDDREKITTIVGRAGGKWNKIIFSGSGKNSGYPGIEIIFKDAAERKKIMDLLFSARNSKKIKWKMSDKKYKVVKKSMREEVDLNEAKVTAGLKNLKPADMKKVEKLAKAFDIKTMKDGNNIAVVFDDKVQKDVFMKTVKTDLRIKQESAESEDDVIEEGKPFWRIPNKVLGNEVFTIGKAVKSETDRLRNDNDFKPNEWDRLIKYMEFIKKSAKKFTAAQDAEDF